MLSNDKHRSAYRLCAGLGVAAPMGASSFRVSTALVDLEVSTSDGVVTAITFHRRDARPPALPIERRIARELQEYCAGDRTAFTFAIDPSGTSFQRAVWNELQRIPYGHTRSYGEIAEAVGRPGAARAVGSANHHNPIPIVIPCHRVIGASGKLTGFGGGLELKRRLLVLEGGHASVLEPQAQTSLF